MRLWLVYISLLLSSFIPNGQQAGYELFQTISFDEGYKISPGRFGTDGLSFYTASEKLVDSLSTNPQELVVYTRNSIHAKFNKGYSLDIDQDMGLRYHQPSLNALGNVIVFAATVNDKWEQNQLYIAERYEYRPVFTEVRALDELNDATDSDAYPFLCADGLTLYYLKGERHYVTRRTSVTEKFNTPVELTTVNALLDDMSWGSQSTIWVNDRQTFGVLLVNTTLYKFDVYSDGTVSEVSKYMELPDGVNYFNSSISFTQDLSQFAVYCTNCVNEAGSVNSVLIFKRK